MKKVLVWDSSIYDLKHGRRFGGIAVQLWLWMKAFAENGWQIHSLANGFDGIEPDNVYYHRIKHIRKLDFFYDWISIAQIIKKVRPDLILVRGAQRILYPLSILSKKFGAKTIMFGASDVNFIPGKANIGNKINKLLYEKAILSHIDYIIAQNQYQAESLKKYFNRRSLIIPNIWNPTQTELLSSKEKLYDVIWVSNLRRLKRVEWLIEAAKALPQYKFAIVGGSNNKAYYEKIKAETEQLTNLEFLGFRPLNETSKLIQRSRILACTSEYEGFPNTFLQAWSVGIPVLSTVDPNNVISEHQIGFYCKSYDDLVKNLSYLLSDREKYKFISENILAYFVKSHSSCTAYNSLINYIKQQT